MDLAGATIRSVCEAVSGMAGCAILQDLARSWSTGIYTAILLDRLADRGMAILLDCGAERGMVLTGTTIRLDCVAVLGMAGCAIRPGRGRS